MTLLLVTFDGTRVSAAENATDGGVWDKWNASQSPSVEPDFFYQGAASLSNKVGTNPGGVEMDQSTGTHDFSSPDRIWLAKVNATNYQALNAKGVDGMILYIGSQNTVDQYRYYVHGNDTYPLAGGWVFIPIDPNIAGYRDFTDGTPDLNNIDYFAVSCDFTGTSKSENVMMDAIDYFDSGTGLTIIRGTGLDPRATFSAFLTFDEGTVGNRFGIIRSVEGILYVQGVLTIGSGTRTDFIDSSETLVFPDARCAAGWCGIDFDLTNALTNIIIDDCVFIGRGDAGGTSDTRPDYHAINALAQCDITSCTFRNFRTVIWTNPCNIIDCVFDGGDSVTQGAATMTGCVFKNGTHGDGAAHLIADKPQKVTGCEFIFKDGHGVELTASGTFAWDDNIFTGLYGADGSTDAMIYNNSGGLVTLNVSGGTSPTIRNGAGASTVVNNNVEISMTALDPQGVGILDVQVAVFQTDNDQELMNEDTKSDGTALEDFNYPGSDVPVYFRFRKSSTGDPKRTPVSGVGTITASGLTVTVTMFDDPNVDV